MAAGDLPVFVTYFRGQEIRFEAPTFFLLFAFRGHSPHLQFCVPFLFKVYSFGLLSGLVDSRSQIGALQVSQLGFEGERLVAFEGQQKLDSRHPSEFSSSP